MWALVKSDGDFPVDFIGSIRPKRSYQRKERDQGDGNNAFRNSLAVLSDESQSKVLVLFQYQHATLVLHVTEGPFAFSCFKIALLSSVRLSSQ
jgi:hypothetical protein